MNEGLYPYTKRYLGSFDNHFSTIGLVGMNEAGLNAKWLRADMTDPKTQQFAKDVLNHMRERLSDYQEMYGNELYNLEATPAESTAFRLAKHDAQAVPRHHHRRRQERRRALLHQQLPPARELLRGYIRGAGHSGRASDPVHHRHGFPRLPGREAARLGIRRQAGAKTIADNYRLPYYTLSPTYSVCPTHGYLAGEHFTCPHCGKTAEVYSRITGYYRPVQNWNDGKSQEYRERREYDVEHHSTWPGAKEKEEEKAAPCCGVLKLFTTRTCPNCAMAKEQLNSIGLVYEVIDAEEHPELAMQYGLRQAPTLIVEKDGEVQKFAGIANVLKFVDANRKAV